MRPTKEEQRQHKDRIIDYLNFDRKGPKRHCNKTISSGHESFPVHDCILGASSDYFRTMFSVEMKEKYEEVINMDTIPPKRLENILEYMYSGDIEITDENMFEVLEDSEYTQMKDLKLFCNQFILQIVSAENCLKLRACALRYSLDDVLEKSNQSIAENFAAVVKQKNFLELDLEDLTVILKLRKDKCEESVFTGVLQWVNHNPHQRESLFVNLFSKIDFSSISCSFLSKIAKENLIRSNLICANMLVDAFVCRTYMGDTGTEFLVVGGSRLENKCVVYDINGQQPKPFPNLNTVRIGATSVKVGKRLYVIGGVDVDEIHHKSYEVFDLNERTRWETCSDVLEPRGYCGSGVIAGQIYVTGGFQNVFLSSCEKLDTKTNRSTKIKNMLQARGHHGTVVCNDVLYCIGGAGAELDLASCECYDVESEQWKKIPSLNEARGSLATAVLNGEIYAIGGENGEHSLSSVEKFKPGSDHWERVASLHIPRRHLSAFTVDNKIYVVGGYTDDHGSSKCVEVYNPTSDCWTTSFELEENVYCATVIAL